MKKKSSRRHPIKKSNLRNVSGGRKYKKLNGAKVFHKTGKIIANPLIYNDYDYFS